MLEMPIYHEVSNKGMEQRRSVLSTILVNNIPPGYTPEGAFIGPCRLRLPTWMK